MTRRIAAAAGIISGGQLTFKITNPGYPAMVPIGPLSTRTRARTRRDAVIAAHRAADRRASMERHPSFPR